MAFTTITDDMACLTAAIYDELIEAHNERALVVGAGVLPLPVVGDIANDGDWWATLQERVEAMVPNFVNHLITLNGEPLPIPMFTLATWRAAAGLHADGFSAYTIHPDDAGVAEHRIGEAGDILGTWLFQEIQAGLKILRKTNPSVGFDPITDTYNEGGPDPFGPADTPTEAAAKTGALTEYNGLTNIASLDISPYVYARLAWFPPDPDPSYEYWTARLRRIGGQYVQWAVAAGSPARDLDFYVVAGLDTPDGTILEFDDNGDLPVDYTINTLYLWLADVNVDGDSGQSSVPFGSLDPPNWPSTPTAPYPDPGHLTSSGYGVTDPYMIATWDFEYV
jgi:hypothetical protein